jgi:hypothetical protein
MWRLRPVHEVDRYVAESSGRWPACQTMLLKLGIWYLVVSPTHRSSIRGELVWDSASLHSSHFWLSHIIRLQQLLRHLLLISLGTRATHVTSPDHPIPHPTQSFCGATFASTSRPVSACSARYCLSQRPSIRENYLLVGGLIVRLCGAEVQTRGEHAVYSFRSARFSFSLLLRGATSHLLVTMDSLALFSCALHCPRPFLRDWTALCRDRVVATLPAFLQMGRSFPKERESQPWARMLLFAPHSRSFLALVVFLAPQ